MDSFKDLGVSPSLIEKLKERSIENPTAIQRLVIPLLLKEKKILFRSATGTGKTFAYLLPALSCLSSPDASDGASEKDGLLVCAPTLELCSQIKSEIDFLTSGKTGLSSALLIGSVSLDRQIETLRKNKPRILVGNPPRLLALAKKRILKLNKLRFLVLDEADRLISPECYEETKELLSVIERGMKTKDLTLAACSATVSGKTLARLGPLFASCEIVQSDDHEILRERIEHWAIYSEKRRKTQTLRSLLAALEGEPKKRKAKGEKFRVKALIFASRNDDAAKILSQLRHHSIAAAGLFGKAGGKPLSGEERRQALDAFREGRASALVSTDLAARGLDIPDITHVISLDVPSDMEAYIHRCGRTGRAGKKGVMVTIGDATQMRLLALLEKKLKIVVNPKELRYGCVMAPEL